MKCYFSLAALSLGINSISARYSSFSSSSSSYSSPYGSSSSQSSSSKSSKSSSSTFWEQDRYNWASQSPARTSWTSFHSESSKSNLEKLNYSNEMLIDQAFVGLLKDPKTIVLDVRSDDEVKYAAERAMDIRNINDMKFLNEGFEFNAKYLKFPYEHVKTKP